MVYMIARHRPHLWDFRKISPSTYYNISVKLNVGNVYYTVYHIIND